MKTYAKSGILAAAQALGVTPNVLGAKLGYESGPAAFGMTEDEAKFLLCPFAICHVAQRFPDDTVFFTNVLSRAGSCAFSGEQGESVTLGAVRPFDEAAAELLKAHLGGNEPTATGVNLPLNAMQGAVLLALADALHRRRLSCMLTGRVADVAFDLADLRREMAFAAAEKDPRWLLPFLQNATGETLLDDRTLPAALASFVNSPMLSVSQDGGIVLTKGGLSLVDALSRADSFLSATSVFYINNVQNIMVGLLLGGGGCEFYLELSAQGFLCTCDADSALAALVTMLAPGDVPGFDAPVEPVSVTTTRPAAAPAEPVQTSPAAGWRCSCGRVNTGKFCAVCGKPKPAQTAPAAGGSWQCSCGRVNTGKFCAVCGKPKPVQTAPVASGSWQCTCGRVNTGKFCAVCGNTKPVQTMPAADGSWRCSCGNVNKGGFCPKCGAKRPR